MSNKTLFGLIALAVSLALFLFLSAGHTTSPKITYRQTPEMGDEIVVAFPPAITEAKARKSFSISPAVAGELQWFEESRELHFVPLEGFALNISYTVKIKQPSVLAQIVSNSKQQVFRPQNLPVKFYARIPGKQTIYYITKAGLKRPVSPKVFFSYPENEEEDIQTIDQQTLNLYPDNLLLQLSNDPLVYKLENGTKRHIQNVETFNLLGFDWNSISPVNQFELDSYPQGEPLDITITKGKFIHIDLETMKLTMWEDGEIVKELPVAGQGNPKTSPTRKGFFTILSKEENHFSSLSRVWMPWSMRYSSNYYLHGWPYWPNGSKLTSKYSAGCVRLFDNDVKKVYQFAEIGTPVLIK